jgi:transposase
VIVVGIDPHSRLHAATAVDEQGRLLEGIEVGSGPGELARLLAWIERLPRPRLVAIENARGYGLALVRLLLAQGEELVDVPATLTSDGVAEAASAARPTRAMRSSSPGLGSVTRSDSCDWTRRCSTTS